MRLVIHPQRIVVVPVRDREPVRAEEGLDFYTGQTLDQPPEAAAAPTEPPMHYVNPWYRLDQELRKRGFRKLKSPNYLSDAQGRRRGNYGPTQPKGRFADYDGTVYVKEPMPNYIWVEAAWIPAQANSNGQWCAYWSPTPNGVVTKCGKTEDEAVTSLFELMAEATSGDEQGKTMNVDLPPGP